MQYRASSIMLHLVVDIYAYVRALSYFAYFWRVINLTCFRYTIRYDRRVLRLRATEKLSMCTHTRTFIKKNGSTNVLDWHLHLCTAYFAVNWNDSVHPMSSAANLATGSLYKWKCLYMILNCHQRCRNAIFNYEASRGIFHAIVWLMCILISLCVYCVIHHLFSKLMLLARLKVGYYRNNTSNTKL